MVRTQAQQLDGVRRLVNPYQQEVILHMALYATLVDTMQLMGLVLRRHTTRLLKMPHHFAKSMNLALTMLVALQVLLELP